jgi:hypothetical protein
MNVLVPRQRRVTAHDCATQLDSSTGLDPDKIDDSIAEIVRITCWMNFNE